MTRHHIRRPPKKNGGFSWGRFPVYGDTAIAWRLWRRDHTGRLHQLEIVVSVDAPRARVATTLRRARNTLRDRVDGIDLRAWGIAA